jgi:L-asparaginase
MRICIVTTGGTIASKVDPDTGAAVPAVAAEELLAEVPGLADLGEVEAVEFSLVNSWDMTPAAMADLARTIAGLAPRADGFVVTHGTDTMEETAFVLDGLLDLDQPVVVTGAMRNASQAGSDGPRNLLAAATVAAADQARGLGGVVVMNDEVHAARHVTKLHTTALDTFGSPGVGPLGAVDDLGLLLWWRPGPRPPLPLVDPDPDVQLVKMVAGLDEVLLRAALDAGAGGVVLEGSGAGNVHAAVQPAVRALVDAGVPVVLASRCPGGRVVPAYGGDGGGATLAALGTIRAGDLNGPKARLALMFALGAGYDRAAIRDWFAGLAA